MSDFFYHILVLVSFYTQSVPPDMSWHFFFGLPLSFEITLSDMMSNIFSIAIFII